MELEESLKAVNNKHLSLLGFVGVGAAALLAVSPVLGMFPAIGVLPFTIMTLVTRYRLNNDLQFAVSGDEYSKKFNNTLDEYIDNSENITEKKYKFLLSQIFLQHKNIKYHELRLHNNEKIDQLEDEIIHTKESSLYANILFGEYVRESRGTTPPGFIDFIDEDIHHPNKIDIAKKVYKDYADMGIIGKNFLTSAWGMTEFCAVLQDYTLSSNDIKHIEALAKMDKSYLNHLYDGSLLVSNNEMYIKIINNNKEHASLFKNLLSNLNNTDRALLKYIDNAEQYKQSEALYQELQDELPLATNTVVRRSKI